MGRDVCPSTILTINLQHPSEHWKGMRFVSALLYRYELETELVTLLPAI